VTTNPLHRFGDLMSVSRTTDDRIPTEHLARVIGALGLAGIALIHILDLPGTLEETPLIGYGYFVLIAAALASAVALITRSEMWVWAVADLIAAGAIVAYVLSRTTGLPTDNLDVGNWCCSLGIAALTTLVVLLAAWRMQPRRLHLVGPGTPEERVPSLDAAR
jgi:hypothetical protein